jgi:hypothetical protein
MATNSSLRAFEQIQRYLVEAARSLFDTYGLEKILRAVRDFSGAHFVDVAFWCSDQSRGVRARVVIGMNDAAG